MTKQRVYNLTDKDLPEELILVKEVFVDYEKTIERRGNESLHDYFTRRAFKCFCKPCAKKRQLERNAKLFEDT